MEKSNLIFEFLQEKMEMLRSLYTFELEYPMANMKIVQNTEQVNLIDQLYEKMRVDLHPLCATETEYEMVESYLQINHSKFHRGFELGIVEVSNMTLNASKVNVSSSTYNKEKYVFFAQIFKVNKHGENERFAKFKGLQRKLLWHGSNLINFSGILSQVCTCIFL